MAKLGVDTHIQVNCPYCKQSYKSVGHWAWILNHVTVFHPEQLEAFQKLDRKDYSEKVLTKLGKAKQKRQEMLLKKKVEMMKKEDEGIMQGGGPVEQPVKEETKKAVQEASVTQSKAPAKAIPPVQVQQKTEEQPQQTTVQKLKLPIDTPLEPEQWLQEFFMKFDLTTKFITFQIEKYKITRKFPHPKELLADLNELDSGSKLKRQNDLIVWFYETALTEYQNKLQRLSMPYDRPIVDFQPDMMRTGSSYTDRGVSLERPQYPSSDQFPRQPAYNTEQQSELRELKARLEQMQQDKYNEMANKLRDMEMKLEQAKTAPHIDSAQQRLEAKLEQMEMETKRLQQALSDQSQQNLMKEIQGAKEAAMQVSRSTPTMDAIQQLITQTLEQERTLKLRPEELDQRIKEAIAKEKTGITKEAVEMSKIDKQYELDKMKLQSDSEKPGQWIDGIKDIAQSAAAVIGDRMGQAMAVKPPMPQTPMPSNLPAEQPIDDEQSMMKTCPSCNKNLLMNLPPGSVGQCPHCGTPLQVTANSGLSVLDMSQPIPQQRPPAPAPVKPMPTQEQPAKKINGDTLGNCVSCGRTLYPWNIAATDDQGNKWCKNCQGAQKDGLSQ